MWPRLAVSSYKAHPPTLPWAHLPPPSLILRLQDLSSHIPPTPHPQHFLYGLSHIAPRCPIHIPDEETGFLCGCPPHGITTHQVLTCPRFRPQPLSIPVILTSLYLSVRVLGCKQQNTDRLLGLAQEPRSTRSQPEPQPKSHLRVRPGKTAVQLALRLHCLWKLFLLLSPILSDTSHLYSFVSPA